VKVNCGQLPIFLPLLFFFYLSSPLILIATKLTAAAAS